MAVNPIPESLNRVMPYLMSSNAQATLDFIVSILGGEVTERIEHSPGVIMHAEAKVGDSMIMLAQSSEQWPAIPAMLYVYVEDVDKSYEQALAAGCTGVKPPETQFYGDRSCMLTDAGGIQWGLASHVEDVSAEEIARRSAQFKGADPG